MGLTTLLRILVVVGVSYLAEADHHCLVEGIDYAGTVDRTKTGVACVIWDDVTWEKVAFLHYEARNHNYCRGTKPWCYTSTTDQKEWEFCDVPRCGKFQVIGASASTVFPHSPAIYGDPMRLTDGNAITRFATNCYLTVEGRMDWIIFKLKKESEVDAVVITPRQDKGLGQRASDVSIYAMEAGVWKKCGETGIIEMNKKAIKCEAKATEIKLERKPTKRNDATNDLGECLELGDVEILGEQPAGWCIIPGDQASWSAYRGEVAVTAQGLPCVDWDKTEFTNRLGTETHNFCRAPIDDPGHRPWCYTNAKYGHFQYCDVPTC